MGSRFFGASFLFSSVFLLISQPLFAKVVVFWQPGFPTVASQPLQQPALTQALVGMDVVFADVASLQKPDMLKNANLLVLPYGSSFPVDLWPAIESYLHTGGNLLVLGGQPFSVPVTKVEGSWYAHYQQDTYARALGFRHTYQIPVPTSARFVWKPGYDFGSVPAVRASRFFTVEEHVDGVGYMRDRDGLLVAAPVIASDQGSSRIVALDFEPQLGYWESQDGQSLIRLMAQYAVQSPIKLSVETLFSTIRPGEPPVIKIHLHNARGQAAASSGEIRLVLSREGTTVETTSLPVQLAGSAEIAAPFHRPLPAGFYTVSATYAEGGSFRAYHQNGFWVEEESVVASGPPLGVRDDFLTRAGQPFFPMGTNYFTTEADGWDFSGPRNASVWERDFDEMERHGVNFVRTGVWMHYARFTEPNAGGGANERFLRNIEALLLSAQRHHIVVNFTFFAFAPRAGDDGWGEPEGTLPNPYLDPGAIASQKAYVRSVVERFKNVPFLTWDLINEPSFSNPRNIFHGNVPNGDPVELSAWRAWLRKNYNNDLAALSAAWSTPATELASFDAIPLPAVNDLRMERYGNTRLVRAIDYNLFAQEMFSDWVRGMVELIHSTGSTQLIDVGQDEGGVTDRLLNQFYGGAGLSFTTNHTYWQDDALLWDSIAAKRPGLPNITGETGYQPVWSPDGAWRYDEFSGLGLIERKWALGFAAGSSGAVQWDWDREADFGMKRSDGSSKVWENLMLDMGEFASKAASHATALRRPDVAIVLPQSLQLSVENSAALQAQQAAVRALYAQARSEAYAVGEYQIDLIGSPKLILLPSPGGLSEKAWDVLLDRVKNGSTLFVTGPFDGDAHLHPTGRQDSIGFDYATIPLTVRENLVHFPWGEESVTFGGSKTTSLNRSEMPEGSDWAEKPLGRGRILFCALPLELSDSPAALGHAYQYALKSAGVKPVYTTEMTDPGILIAPTVFPDSTLYVITSESNQSAVNFVDVRSGAHLTGVLAPGSAAMVLIGADGRTLAAYHWPSVQAR